MGIGVTRSTVMEEDRWGGRVLLLMVSRGLNPVREEAGQAVGHVPGDRA